jgi:hypothetical protein
MSCSYKNHATLAFAYVRQQPLFSFSFGIAHSHHAQELNLEYEVCRLSPMLLFFLFLLSCKTNQTLTELQETNLAELGSQLDKVRRKEEGALEPAWDEDTGVGSKAGLWVWRIEQFKVVAVPKRDQGSFYTGDSYIVLNVSDSPRLELTFLVFFVFLSFFFLL